MTDKKAVSNAGMCVKLMNQDSVKCPSFSRISNILNTFQYDAINTREYQQINSMFKDGKYTESQLLNDFNHLKFDHNIDNNDIQFSKLFQHLKHNYDIRCDLTCKHIKQYYIGRDKSFSEHISSTDDMDIYNAFDFEYGHILQLISRIHVYFIHSYDINSRLTPKQIHQIEQKLTEHDSKESDELEQQTMEIITTFANNNTEVTEPARTRNTQKFLENVSVALDFQRMHLILQEHRIQISQYELKSAFSGYKNKNEFIMDLMNAYYGSNSNISITFLPKNHEIRNRLYEVILFNYIQSHDLNDENFIKIAVIIIREKYPAMQIDQFVQIAMNEHITGKIFIKDSSTFKNSSAFARLFNSIDGYKKKQLTKIYSTIKKWTPIKLGTTIEQKNIEIKEQKSNVAEYSVPEEKEMDCIEKSKLYEIGTRWYFWDSMKTHPQYVKQEYTNFKDEMLQSNLTQELFDAKVWNGFRESAKTLLTTDKVKAMSCNGYYKSMYKIEENAPITLQHLLSITIYTDSTTLCNIMCSVLREADKKKIAQIANWVKLLTECVQCFGTSLDDKRKYYRGIDCVLH
eukprot:515905_1